MIQVVNLVGAEITVGISLAFVQLALVGSKLPPLAGSYFGNEGLIGSFCQSVIVALLVVLVNLFASLKGSW